MFKKARLRKLLILLSIFWNQRGMFIFVTVSLLHSGDNTHGRELHYILLEFFLSGFDQQDT